MHCKHILISNVKPLSRITMFAELCIVDNVCLSLGLTAVHPIALHTPSQSAVLAIDVVM